MNMKLIPICLEGCFEVHPLHRQDERGVFLKTFNVECFGKLGLPTDWKEEYYSISRKGVIRGMHFQTPPYDHAKLVYCLQGRVLDAIVDLRTASPTYRQYVAVELNADRRHGLIIPKGMAHGFLALTDDVLMAYKVTTVYQPVNDAGIRWDSFGLNWGIQQPIISARDSKLPTFENFKSPF